jgi:hypothetical protein
MSQILTVLSQELLASFEPLSAIAVEGLKQTDETGAAWLLRISSSWPVLRLQR